MQRDPVWNPPASAEGSVTYELGTHVLLTDIETLLLWSRSLLVMAQLLVWSVGVLFVAAVATLALTVPRVRAEAISCLRVMKSNRDTKGN